MTDCDRERYSRLKPLEIDLEAEIARLAVEFFSPRNYRQNCRTIGKDPAPDHIPPLPSWDFLTFLDRRGVLGESADRYIYPIRNLLGRMAASNLLVEMTSVGSNIMMPKSYSALIEITHKQSEGCLWLAKALGGRFIHRQVSPAIVHITGTKEDKAASGSGIVFHPLYILTCRHVVSEMEIDEIQRFQGKEIHKSKCSVMQHEELDVAVIRVNVPLETVSGLAFRAPFVTETVYAFGYPKIPNVRPKTPQSVDSYLIVQRGEVTNDSVIASDGTRLFLYSALSRPGNSGGAIVSDDGYVVGISTNLTEGRYESEGLVAPHHAGIPSDVIDRVVDEMGLNIRLPYEFYE